MKTNKKKAKIALLILAGLLVTSLSFAGQISAIPDDRIPTVLTIDVFPSEIFADESLTITAILTASDLTSMEGKPVDFYFTTEIDGNIYTDTGYADADGKATVTFDPGEVQDADIIISDGVIVSFYAEYLGDVEYAPSSTFLNPNSFKVNFRPTELSLSLSDQQMAPTETLTLTASLLYEESTGTWFGVPDAPIYFFYMLETDPDWTGYMDFVLTNGDGVATVDFVPSDYGGVSGSTVYFKAVFHGVVLDLPYESYFGYLPSESEQQALELAPAGGVIPEYALGGLLAIMACFAALATFTVTRKRKK